MAYIFINWKCVLLINNTNQSRVQGIQLSLLRASLLQTFYVLLLVPTNDNLFHLFCLQDFCIPPPKKKVHLFGKPIALPRRLEVYPVGREWLELSKPLSCPSMFLCWSLFYRSRRSKQQPYEKEKALCDTLMAHLEKLHKTLLPDVQVSPLPDKDPVPSLAANTGKQQ